MSPWCVKCYSVVFNSLVQPRFFSAPRSLTEITKDQNERPPRGATAIRVCLDSKKLDQYSTARAKGAIRRLDFQLTLVLSARGEPERAARSLNNRAAGAFVWIIDKLVEPDL
jgi:hypothetical protein